MPLPDRPVAGADIETEWGQDIHDRVFAPKGCNVKGATGTNVDTTWLGLVLDTAIDDPGGWLGTGSIEAPTGAEGLYSTIALFRATGATDGQTVLAAVAVNGSLIAAVPIVGETGAAIQGSVPLHLELTAGDIVSVQARKYPSGGATPNVQLLSLSLVRIGDDYGA